jgi:hypothetical protein
VWIDVQVVEDSSHITLHSSQLQIVTATASLLMNNETLEMLPFPAGGLRNYSYRDDLTNLLLHDPERGTVTMRAPLTAGGHYRLHLRYKGHLSNTLTGFYKSSYNDGHNKTRWVCAWGTEMITTCL